MLLVYNIITPLFVIIFFVNKCFFTDRDKPCPYDTHWVGWIIDKHLADRDKPCPYDTYLLGGITDKYFADRGKPCPYDLPAFSSSHPSLFLLLDTMIISRVFPGYCSGALRVLPG
jgi:hypothetical protein